MADILSLKESVVVYLDRSGGLQKLAEECRQFNGKPAGNEKLANASCYHER